MDIEPDNLLQADTEATEQLSIKKQLDQGARALAFVWILVILLVTLFMVTHEPRSFYGQDGWPLPCPPRWWETGRIAMTRHGRLSAGHRARGTAPPPIFD